MPSGIYEHHRRKKHIELKCKHCGKIFEVQPCFAKGRKKYCSWKCRNLYKHGKHLYQTNNKPRITPLIRLLRESLEYKQWRSDVFRRDSWICQTCQKRGLRIEAHHIKSFTGMIRENNILNYKNALEFKELWDINNGITLCKICHNLTKMGRKT